MRRNVRIFIVGILLVLLAGVWSKPASAMEAVVYTAPDGMKIAGYAAVWQDKSKLREVYLELQKNLHGDEIKLLSRINIYPGPAPDNSGIAGQWFGEWREKNGRLILEPGRYIDIYNGDSHPKIEDIARTLAHEYGHHFTYYYYYKFENKPWDKWAGSEYARARQISGNKKISSGANHYWQIQEIAAEDYVQLFGSPTAKKSVVYSDIQDRIGRSDPAMRFTTATYNVQPQENWHLPLAASLPQVRDYWLKASGLKDSGDLPPSRVLLSLAGNTDIAGHRQYVFTWTPADDHRKHILEYTLVRFQESYGTIKGIEPIRTVYDGTSLTARYGAAENRLMYTWTDIPPGVSCFVVFIKDQAGNIVASNVIAVDFSNKKEPEYVSIDDKSLLTGGFLIPRVKVNGEQLKFDVAPVIRDGRLMVPLRLIFEKLGAVVEWDSKNSTITATRPGITMKMRVGDRAVFLNGSWIESDVPSMTVNGRTLVPLRFISETMGADVGWNQNLQLAQILSE